MSNKNKNIKETLITFCFQTISPETKESLRTWSRFQVITCRFYSMLHWAPCWQISIAFSGLSTTQLQSQCHTMWASISVATPLFHVPISLLVDFLMFGCNDITTLEPHLPCYDKNLPFTHVTWYLQISFSAPLCFILSRAWDK